MANVVNGNYQHFYGDSDEDEDFGMENRCLQTLMGTFNDFRQVFVYHRKPSKLPIIHVRNSMR